MFAIAKFISDLFGWDPSKAQRWVTFVLIAAVGIVILSVAFWAHSCFARHQLKVTQAQVEKINKANEAERKQELQKVIDENTDVVKTVDNRTELVNADIYQRIQSSDQRVAAADKQIQAAKDQGRDVTQEELQCILVPSDCPQ